MLATVAEAVSARWGKTEELLATIAEIAHELLRVTVQVNSRPNSAIPKPLRIPRPGDERPPSMSMGQMARRMLAGR